MIGGEFYLVISDSCRQNVPVVILPPTLTSSPRVIHQSTETISPTVNKVDSETPEANPDYVPADICL